MGGALQQVEMFIKEVEESDVMPEEKQAALNIATSQKVIYGKER